MTEQQGAQGSAIDRAIEAAGGVRAVCKKLSINSQESVYKWKKLQKVPPARVVELIRLTNGQVRCHEIDPVHYPRDPENILY